MRAQNNIGSAISSINAIFEHLDADLDKLLRKTTQKIHDDTERNIEPHNKTGALLNAVKNGTVKGGYWTGVDTQDAPHAMFVHFPTRPHLIKPKDKKSLRWAGNGKFHFAKVIKHPGYKGDPFFYDAIDSGMRYLEQQAKQLKVRD